MSLFDRSPRIVWTTVVSVPLVLTAIVLLWRPWAPTLDLAMTELRVRDVGTRDTPLIGLPGRIGDFPEQGSHPGPWSFYLLAPFYWLSGRRAWGLEFGSVAINAAAVAALVWLGHRWAGARGALVTAAVAAVAVRGYGVSVLSHPWNPYFPLLFWLVVLIATWLVVRGDTALLPLVVVVASISAQTHIPYLLNGIAMCAIALGATAWWWRAGDVGARRSLGVGTGVGAVIWLPPFADQIWRDPGNISMIIDHFTGEPAEERIALADAIKVFFRHLDAFAVVPDLVMHGDAFVHRSGLADGSGAGGVVVAVIWTAAVVWAWRRRHRALIALHAVLGTALLVQIVAISRIFGKVWYYLTLWAWGTTLLVVGSICWTAWCLIGERRVDHRDRDERWLLRTLAGVVVAVSLVSAVAAFSVDEPEPHVSRPLRALLPDTVAALDAGVGPAPGPDATYVVFWQDALFFGSQGYGLVNELERRGFDVGVHDTWRVPVTPHRVVAPGSFDAEIHLVTGAYIDEWRERPGFVEVAWVDERSDDERARYAELRSRVSSRLADEGRPDLDPVVDSNLFGVSLDPDLPRDVIDDLSEMIEIGLPAAVFFAPPGNSF